MNTTVSGLPLGLFLRVHCGSGGNADVERQPQTRTQNKGTTRERLNLAHPSTDTWKHFPSIFTPKSSGIDVVASGRCFEHGTGATS